MYRLMSSSDTADEIASLYNYGYSDLVQTSGKLDVYNGEALAEFKERENAARVHAKELECRLNEIVASRWWRYLSPLGRLMGSQVFRG